MFEKLCALKNKEGFTLIEMLVVIGIIAVLVAIIVPTVVSSTGKAKAATDAANLRTLQSSAAIAYMDDSKIESDELGTLPECKTFPGATVKFYKDGSNLVAYFVVTGTGAGNYDANAFAAVADGTAETPASVSPAGSEVTITTAP